MFIIKAAFWLAIVILLIPGDPNSGVKAPRVGLIDALSAARGAVADLSGMCDRQPDVCVSGGAALEAFGAKARYGANLLYGTVDAKLPSSVRAVPAQNTLTEDDAEPQWRKPAPTGGKA